MLWSLLVFLTGVFLGAFEPLPASPTPARRLAKGIGVLACLYGALLLIGATLGGDDPLRPIPQGAVRGGSASGLLAAQPRTSSSFGRSKPSRRSMRRSPKRGPPASP